MEEEAVRAVVNVLTPEVPKVEADLLVAARQGHVDKVEPDAMCSLDALVVREVSETPATLRFAHSAVAKDESFDLIVVPPAIAITVDVVGKDSGQYVVVT